MCMEMEDTVLRGVSQGKYSTWLCLVCNDLLTCRHSYFLHTLARMCLYVSFCNGITHVQVLKYYLWLGGHSYCALLLRLYMALHNNNGKCHRKKLEGNRTCLIGYYSCISCEWLFRASGVDTHMCMPGLNIISSFI